MQRKVAVKTAETKASDKVVQVEVEARGPAKDFKEGSSAKSIGWNGVETYGAHVKINGVEPINSAEYSNKFLVAQAGHVLAEQNGGDGEDKYNVFGQDGGANNGPYRTDFENPMRRAVAAAEKKDPETTVRFVAVLKGKNIVNGPLKKVSKELVLTKAEDNEYPFSSDSDSSDDDAPLAAASGGRQKRPSLGRGRGGARGGRGAAAASGAAAQSDSDSSDDDAPLAAAFQSDSESSDDDASSTAASGAKRKRPSGKTGGARGGARGGRGGARAGRGGAKRGSKRGRKK
ncbi:hypothetical protein [Dyella flagellata]|uniref:hypothetical protein n=1 Tax=Dyella flagellata TaxID=1867833 RepID=UPI0024E18C3A|nr:hypothetical protein [Dyella flagellata]